MKKEILALCAFLSCFSITYSQRSAPVIPNQGAFETGNYRNILAEAGYTNAQIQDKIDNAWQQLFYGNDSNERLYYPVGSDGAYIRDVNNNDVRSEGMSYGMMICVQLDKKEEFDRLWNWSKTNLQHQSGNRVGFFAWQTDFNGGMIDPNPASDGEIYFATALYFAATRWGNGTGIYNYQAEADYILRVIQEKDNAGEGITNMFNKNNKQVVFAPIGNSATFTNPSYHLPSFYEVWARVADQNQDFWSDAATASRNYFPTTANPNTGLMPEYSNFDGSPKSDIGKGNFEFDAMRCIMNAAIDYSWFKGSSTEKTIVENQLAFFHNIGVNNYVANYTLGGSPLVNYRSTALISSNAVGALASSSVIAWDFLDNFMQIGIPTGQFRYYDGMLYFLSLLHVSGNFKAYVPGTGGGGNPTLNEDDIASVNAPTSVQRGNNVSVTVNYSASTNRDIYVVFQLDQSPWTGYAQQKQDVSAGSGTLTFNLNIPSNTPIANNSYQFQTFITTNGGAWGQRLDNIAKADIDVVNGGGNSGGDELSEGTYRFQNVSNNRYMDADGGGRVKLNGSNGNKDQEWGLHSTSGGYYNIDSRFNGRGILDTDPNGVVKWTSTSPTNNNDGFEWKPIKLSNGNYRFENRINGRKYLRYNGNSNTIGYSNTADSRSEWKLTRVGALKTSTPSVQNENTNISIYPNPTSSNFEIRLTGSNNATASILNIQGQLIGEYKIIDNQLSLDASNWSSGVYFINTIDDSGTILAKILRVE